MKVPYCPGCKSRMISRVGVVVPMMVEYSAITNRRGRSKWIKTPDKVPHYYGENFLLDEYRKKNIVLALHCYDCGAELSTDEMMNYLRSKYLLSKLTQNATNI